MLIQKIIALIWFHWMKKTSSQIEDKRKDKAQGAYTHWNPKRHIPLVSLLLWCKIVAMHCFIVSQSGSETKIRVLVIFKKFYTWPPVSVLLYIYIYTTFTPHFKGKRRCISGIIALLAVLRNAVTRIGGSIYKLYPS